MLNMEPTLNTRLFNVRKLVKEAGSAKAFAQKVGRSLSFISQMTGPNPTRTISEKTARHFEEVLQLEANILDLDTQFDMLVGKSSSNASERAAAIVEALASIWEFDKVNLSVGKFAQIASYVITDVAETGKTPTEENLRRLIKLF